MTCEHVIDLAKPTKGAWEGRGFGRKLIYTYVCPACGTNKRIIGRNRAGSSVVPAVGGVVCGASRPLTGS